MNAWVYILLCSDGKYYVGSHRGNNVDERVYEHNAGIYKGFTFYRRPVKLLWAEHFQSIREAVYLERQIKGWSRAKKDALMAGDGDSLRKLSKSYRSLGF